jgi:hypothetical protein
VQRPLVGALLTATPFAVPHTPFTGWGCCCACAGQRTMSEMRRANTVPRI